MVVATVKSIVVNFVKAPGYQRSGIIIIIRYHMSLLDLNQMEWYGIICVFFFRCDKF